MDWQPIETAPKDGTLVDLWMEEHWAHHWNQDGTPRTDGEIRKACRFTDCWWSKDALTYYPAGTKEGWACFKNFYIGDHITHWMPSPTPPLSNHK